MAERENLPAKLAAQDLAATTEKRGSLVARGMAALRKDSDALYQQARAVFDRGDGIRNWDAAENPAISFAFKIFQQLANENFGKAYYPLSILYCRKRDIEEGQDRAQHFAQLAFDWCFANQANQDAELWCDLGEMYKDGCGVEQNDKQAMFWFRKAGEQGNAQGQMMLGRMYMLGIGWKSGEYDDEDENEDAIRINTHVFSSSLFDLLNDERDEEQAVYWLRKAAEQGNAHGQVMLGEMYKDGRGVEQDDELAVYWFRKAAEQGYAAWQISLGEMYVLGRGVEQDCEQAVYWFRKAAEQDNEDAQFNLGEMYRQGYGIEQDDEKAVYWFRKAAEQGRDFAQYSLAKMYQYGRGVGQDDEQAVYWYRKAREQDDGVTKWNFDYNGGWRFNCDHWGRRFPHSPRTIDFPYETAPQDMVVMLSHTGYIKAQLLADHLAQPAYSEGINRIFIASSADYILCFSDRGRVYWTNVYEVPPGNHISRGLQLEDGEKIIATLPVKEFDDKHFIFMATSSGIVKKAPLTDFSRPMKRGIVAINLDEDDFLIGAAITDGQRDIMLFSDDGKAVRFEEGDVRETGRNSRGVFGMRLCEGQKVISLLVGEDDDEIVLITNTDRMVRTSVKEIRGMGRATQGVTLIHLSENEKLSGLDKLMKPIVRE